MKWITATNLEQWAATLQARTVFPELVADLIRASSSEISSIRFPSGDKGQIRGFDGVLESAGVPPYVPDGHSIWEFGVTGNVMVKANDDYTKRTNELAPEIRANTTFVFVTLRTWDNPKRKIADWLEEKRGLGEWKAMEYFDGVALEAWLSCHPAVASRYARYELKLMPQLGAYSTDEYWQEYSSRFSPSLVEDVLLAGRESQAASLLQRLVDGTSSLPFAADSPDEVVAFAVAAIRRADPVVRLYLEARTLVVDSEECAQQLANKEGLIFLPRGQARRFAGLLAQSGPTIVSAGADEQRRAHEVLPRPSSSELGRAIQAMGYSIEKGYELARKCGRSLAVLARQIPSGTAEPPEWIQHGDALLPALLVGAWKVSTPADKAILAALAGRQDYEGVEAPLRPLTKLKDPPVDRVGDVWTMRASVDAFVNLAHLLGEEHLARFALAATEVFSKIAPPPKPDELFRPPANREDTHSNWLREGMMTTLLHMAVLHEQTDFAVQGTTPQDYVNDIVRKLPGLSSDYRLLASLQDNLALLAEAAPIPFLDALERLLEGDAAAINPIFEEQKGLLTSHSSHNGVLWALETLAWDPHYLLRAATCLARLAAIDPGGSTSNRPINSLREIFLTWLPSTDATAKQRLGVLTHVVQVVPSIAWPLLVKLLPRHNDISTPTAKPKFRESTEISNESLTYSLVWESQDAVIKLALQHAGANAERWETLVETMAQFQLKSFDRTLGALGEFLETHAASARFKVWDALRKEANRHHAFATAQWALKEDILGRLDALVVRFQPDDPLSLSTWLFDEWIPTIPPNADSLGDRMKAIEALRIQALSKMHGTRGVLGIVELAKAVKLPQLIASPLSNLDLPSNQLTELLHAAIRAGEGLEPLAAFVVADGFARFGSEWADEIHKLVLEMGLDSATLARLFLAMPEERTSWDLVAQFGAPVADTYWKVKYAYGISGSVEDLFFAAETYLAYGRPISAIETTHDRLGEIPSEFLLRLLDAAVPQINEPGANRGTMTAYLVEQIFEELEKRTDITSLQIAQREYSYLPIFNHRTKPLTLHRLMVESPEMFMSAVCAVFRPNGEDAPKASPEAVRLATAIYELLGGLNVLPGQQDEDVELETLSKWCTEVRRLGAENNRKVVTDLQIGHLLAHAPASAHDQAWPHESVRTVIELLASEDVERGVTIERFNMRGAYTKAMGEGGQQERVLAEQARDWAAVMPQHPRTSAMLIRIAESWTRDANEADLHAAKDALRW